MQRLSRRYWTAAVAVVLVGVAGARPLCALEPGRAITQYVREAWIAKDGAPAGTITGITQTPDGYLWLGTEGEGLVRFDGVTFVHMDDLDGLFGLRVDGVTSLISGRDGALWVGTTHGLARLKGGRWTAFDRGDAKYVLGLHEAPDGAVWYTRHWEGLFRVSGETVSALPLTGKPRFVTTDTRGTVWVGGYEGLWRLAGAQRRLYSSEDGLLDRNVTQIQGDGAGNVWVGLQQGLTLIRNDRVAAHFTTRDGLSNDEVSAIYVDRDRALWVGTVNGGLNRRRGERFESLTKALGFTNNRVTAIFEDGEGSLWVGTAGGLNRLRDASVLPIGEAEGLSPTEPQSIVAGDDGSVYISSGLGGLNWIKDGRIRVLRGDTGSDSEGALFIDPDGALWSGHQDGLSYRRGERRARYRVEGLVQCVGHDGRSLVFATTHGEVFRLVGGKPEPYRLADGSALAPGPFGIDFVWMMHEAGDGTFWLATSRGAIAVRDGQARQVWHQGTLAARSIHEDEQGTLWFGTEAGVLRISHGSPALVTTKEGLLQDAIYHVLSDGQGGLWMSSAGGIFRVQRRNLEEVVQGKAQTLEVDAFGMAEGMRTLDAASARQPTACATRDGRLWFAMNEGVVVVDPAHIRRNPLPPPVLVEAVVADGERLGLRPRVPVSAGTERLAIHYNGLSLLVPQRVRFQYKLEGYDRSWVDAGGRRVAYYTKLPPESYRFRVMAANNDGVWNEAGASIDIQQLPRFFQTTWFVGAVTIAVAGCALGLYRLRDRQHQRVERELQTGVREALAQIKTLSGLLPICAWCKKVRDDTGYWSQIETYVGEHSEAAFSRGICPDCAAKVAASAKSLAQPEPAPSSPPVKQ